MKEELYKKIYINSEDDLPKKAMAYFCHDAGNNTNDVLWFDESQIYYWDNIDWYLQPIEPVKAEKEACNNFHCDPFVNEYICLNCGQLKSKHKAEKQTYTPNPPMGSTTDFEVKIILPPECRECGNQNSDNCNTCDILNPQFR